MNKSIIVPLFFIVFFMGCAKEQSKNSIDQVSENGLLVEISRYRGTEFTDSLGIEYNLRYRPMTITNANAKSVYLQFSFLETYEYKGNKFKIIPLPEEWGKNGGDWGIMWKEFQNFLEQPTLELKIAPGEKSVFAIGELLPKPIQFSINIDTLFAHNKEGVFSDCNWRMQEKPLSGFNTKLGLMLDLADTCRIIPCGQISYDEQ